ncbi:hypothetical protein [Candidatus Chloroploca asiatica]|uniref:hypothetical protein n=1 Tax=Candidatus Chloroploca asiatica TaxID=1506545 RepID=UPI001559F109|nr:hypothetical protein [Candidatus Chloroploca asiatica]
MPFKGMRRQRLARESAKRVPADEQALAEEGFDEDMKIWPEYYIEEIGFIASVS